MGNKESGLRTPPAQSRFGPWFYETNEHGLGDVPFMGILSFFVSFAIIQFVLSFGLISQAVNIRDKKERREFIKRSAVRFCAMFFMIFVGWAILGSSFAYTWKQDYLEGEMPYKAFSNEHIHARVGVHVGLRGLNITLVGLPKRQHCQLIQWNEQYLWSEGQNELGGWLQGRFGFGPYANLLAQQFRAGQMRGTPLPILEVLEWFTIDGEFIRWNRWFRDGGYYCHIFLWLAFVFWVFTIIVAFINPATSSLWLALTGCAMWFGAAVYHGLTEKAEPALKIPFDNRFLEPKFGWAFHLTLVLGILVNIIGLALYYGFRYYGFRTDAFTLSSSEKIRVHAPTSKAASDAYEAKQMELADVTTEKTAAGEEAVIQEPVYDAGASRRGFQQPSARRVTFGRTYSVMNSGTSRRRSFEEPSFMGSGFGRPRPRPSQPERGSLGQPSLRARSSRRTVKHFGRSGPGSTAGPRSVRSPPRQKDTFEGLAGMLDNLGGSGGDLAPVAEAEEVPEVHSSSSDNDNDDNGQPPVDRNASYHESVTGRTNETSI
ncbi:hypothetical protein PTSG_12394 [Salpingoeca rosetta]|uniref:Dual oxidase maturation factor 1 n=1 Tax=Salpingoeca rosetta (strain ATCC 50818 / BSB-021) TaxID=946362 RepID=F2UDP1_SALR5|nr:uncharacterized protein PTSG_12394 [Salpingoeca rosetta]EGD74736.1 hypothetical protein PTSG_12394 [Salpingoeca rosetta]|eukprot:XP_004992993.1 hypothetical protein PTSG_12394 [Salpingoeca rosetta]